MSEPLEVTLDRPGDGLWLRRALGTVRVEVQGPRDQELFVGLARSRDVDGYLRGVAVDRVVAMTGDGATYDRRAGTAAPLAPADQRFWTTSAQGAGPLDLEWDVEGGRWSIVVMDADASAGVTADVRLGATLPWLLELSLGALAVGGVLLLTGAALMALASGGARREPPSDLQVPAPRTPSAPTSTPYVPGPLL